VSSVCRTLVSGFPGPTVTRSCLVAVELLMGHKGGDLAGNLFERAGHGFALAIMESKPAGGRSPVGAGMTGEEGLPSERVFRKRHLRTTLWGGSSRARMTSWFPVQVLYQAA
jgi:hypothetical protein